MKIGRFSVFLASSFLFAASAQAGEALLFGPAPDWVNVRPETALPHDAANDVDGEVAVRTLYYDQQALLEPGNVSTYAETVMRIETPQGLSAGNLSLGWSPEHQDITVHKLRIVRDGQDAIDVLDSGQTFTILRREQNLDMAMLDGRLTANILPEGLQVGDTIELATTTTSRNPVFGNHVEAVAGPLNFPVDKAQVRFVWPTSLDLKLGKTDGLPEWKRGKSKGYSTAEIVLEKPEVIIPPRGAPARYGISRFMEATDFGSWSELAALFAPMYDTASKIPAEGKLREEVERIRALSDDPVVLTEAALQLVQNRIRYVALAMGEGGLVPASAADTWTRRYGDCKAKTALLLGILEEFGIDAEPVFVSVYIGDAIGERLPAVGLFDHVILRANVGGKDYWLDGTRTGDSSLARVAVPYLGWGLPLRAADAKLVNLVPEPLAEADEDLNIYMDARGGLGVPAPSTFKLVLRGDKAIATNQNLATMSASVRDQSLRRYWRDRFDFVEVKSAAMTFDQATGELTLSMTGDAEMEWRNGWYETDETWVGYQADFTREAGPKSGAPWLVNYPFFDRTVQTIALPSGPTQDWLDQDGDTPIDETVAGLEYRRSAKIENNVVTIERTVRSVAPEFPAAEASQAQKRLRELFDQTVHLRRPDNYMPTGTEISGLLNEKADGADALIARGSKLLDVGSFADALVDFEDAAVLEPNNADAWAGNAITLTWMGEIDRARVSLARAERIDSRNAFVLRTKAFLAQSTAKPAAAISAYTASLDVEPGNLFAIGNRAQMHWALRDADAALADIDAALKESSHWFELYFLKADIQAALGNNAAIAAVADSILDVDSRGSEALYAAARLYGFGGQTDKGVALYDRLIEELPSYLVDGNLPALSVEGKDASAVTPEQIRDGQTEMRLEKGATQARGGDHLAALASYDQILLEKPDHMSALVGRGVALWRLDRRDEAAEAFSLARNSVSGANDLNSICWLKAIEGVGLENALEECNASLKLAPGVPDTQDSRALVYLQMGRLDDAIREYTAVLKKEPQFAPALYGRGIAYFRMGDLAKANTDLAAAFAAAPTIAMDFVNSGLQAPLEIGRANKVAAATQ